MRFWVYCKLYHSLVTFHCLTQNEAESLRGGSNEYLQSMFLSKNKKNNVYPCKLQFYCIKVGFKGVNFVMDYLRTYWRSGSDARRSALSPGGYRFDLLPIHTKDFENGTSCSFVYAQHRESGTGRPYVSIM